MSPDNPVQGRNSVKRGRPGEVMCPHCSAMVQPARMERHILHRHSETLPPVPVPEAAAHTLRRKPSSFETCAVCGKTMHKRFLAEHNKQHEPAKQS